MAEGLSVYRQEAVSLRHLREPQSWSLDDVVAAIRAQQAQRRSHPVGASAKAPFAVGWLAATC